MASIRVYINEGDIVMSISLRTIFFCRIVKDRVGRCGKGIAVVNVRDILASCTDTMRHQAITRQTENRNVDREKVGIMFV